MKHAPNRKFLFYLIFFFILVLNIQILANTNLTGEQSKSYTFTFNSNTNFFKSIPVNKKPHLLANLASSTSANYSIRNIIQYNFTLNDNSTGDTILINSTQDGSIGYFELNQSLSTSFLSINLFNSQNSNSSNLLTYYSLTQPINKTYAKISFSRSSFWRFYLNSTFDYSKNANKTFNLQLKLYLPTNGYSFADAINAYDFTTANSPINKTSMVYSASFPYEVIYFKISVEDNRRASFIIQENDQFSNILEFSTIYLYQADPTQSNPNQNPRLLPFPTKNTNGSYSYSWVSSNRIIQSNTLWIKIELNHFSNSQTSSAQYSTPITGNFTLSFSFQKAGYSYDTATNLLLNHSLDFYQINDNKYGQTSFFKFQMVRSDANISIYAKSADPLVLANSQFLIYYDGEGNPINVHEDSSPANGSIYLSFIVSKTGTYYIEYQPWLLADTGTWSITISYVVLPAFVWSFESILINIFYFMALPVIVFYFMLRKKSEEIIEWELDQNYTDIYKVLSKNPRLNPKMEVPYQKILLLRKNILIRDIIIDIVPIHADEEESNSMVAQSAIGLRYKNTFDTFLSMTVIVGLVMYWIINIISYKLVDQTILPYRVADLNSINFLVYYLIIPVTFFLLIIYFYKESYLKFILNEIEYSINDSTLTKTLNSGKNSPIDIENIMKNLAYVRVLWNQAIKAFNEKNYSLFIIRADNSVKKLIETRFQQLVGTIDEKLEFNSIIESVRNQGFDIPSTKKIEYFRKVRNKVVHSSHMLDEKTAIETYTYYSKFLGRLGLRT